MYTLFPNTHQSSMCTRKWYSYWQNIKLSHGQKMKKKMKISTKNEKKMRCHEMKKKNEKMKKNKEWTACHIKIKKHEAY